MVAFSKKGLDEGERGSRLELQSDPGSETLQGEVGAVGVRPSGPSSLERCANYDNRKTRLRLWDVILMNVPSDRMTTMLLNVISAESEFERSLVDKFCGGHSAEQMTRTLFRLDLNEITQNALG